MKKIQTLMKWISVVCIYSPIAIPNEQKFNILHQSQILNRSELIKDMLIVILEFRYTIVYNMRMILKFAEFSDTTQIVWRRWAAFHLG